MQPTAHQRTCPRDVILDDDFARLYAMPQTRFDTVFDTMFDTKFDARLDTKLECVLPFVTADLGFERTLWASTDPVCGHMDPSAYRRRPWPYLPQLHHRRLSGTLRSPTKVQCAKCDDDTIWPDDLYCSTADVNISDDRPDDSDGAAISSDTVRSQQTSTLGER